MDYSQVMEMMEQYLQDGKDMRTLYEHCTALAAAGKTPLGLNQWVKSDKPLMEDFNEDNRMIDEKLRELATGKVDNTPIADYDIPLEPGIGGSGKYRKNQLGEVSFYFTIQSAAGFTHHQHIATLPAGFRPAAAQTAALSVGNPGFAGVMTMYIQPDGKLLLTVDKTGYTTAACYWGNFVARQ